MTVRGYQLAADWDADGAYTGTLEDLTSRLSSEVLTCGYGRDTAQAASPMASGRLDFALHNRDKAFSPENTASPIAGLVEPGRSVRLVFSPDLVEDAFGRTTTSGWGNADSGQGWTATGGSASDYSVTSGVGRHSLGTVGVARRVTAGDVTRTATSALVQVTVPVVAAGGPIDAAIILREVDSSNYYRARLRVTVSGAVELALLRTLAGVTTTLATGAVNDVTHTAGGSYWLRAEAVGAGLRMRAWPTTLAEPSWWTVTATDTSHSAGRVGLASELDAGNTNTLPVVVTYDSVSTAGAALFEGVLDALDVDTASGGKTFTGECLDAWGRPGAEKLSTPVYAGIRTGTAVGHILDAIGWTGGRDLDPGATIIAWWWEEGTDAATAVERLVASEGPPAVAYVEGGTFVFRDRHHRLLRSASATVQGTYSHAVPPGSRPGTVKILRGTEYDRGLGGVINTVAATVEQRIPGVLTPVWTSEETFTLAASEVLALEASATDPFINAVVPEAGTDYVLTSGTVTVWMTRTSGQAVTIYVQAVAGAAVVTGMALRAMPLPVTHTRRVLEEDPSSITKYGRRAWQGEAPWADHPTMAAIARTLVATYAAPRPTITITIAHQPGHPVLAGYLPHIVSRRISDRVRIIEDDLGLDDEFFVERIEHEIVKLGALHRLRLGCQVAGPDQPDPVFRFDTAGHGFDDGLFGVEGIDEADNVFRFDAVGHGFDDGRFAT